VEWSLFTGVLAGFSVILMTYSLARAAMVPLTYDEAATYQWYVDTDLLSMLDLSSPTNHLLNTLLVRLSHSVGGGLEVILRAPSLLGHLLYLLFSALLLHGLHHRFVAIAGFLLLNLNPYVVDYFSLSRGYGLGLGLLMAALYFLVRLVTGNQDRAATRRHVAGALLLSGAAVAASTPLLLVYLGIWSVGVVVMIARWRRVHRRERPGGTLPSHRGASRGWVWLALSALLFNGIVLAQDEGLSGSLYEPIAVRIRGLLDDELDTIVIKRLDTRSRWRPLPRDGDTWQTEQATPVRALRVELPAAAARNFAVIAATVGPTTFRYGRRTAGPWTIREADGIHILESNDSLSLPRATVPSLRGAINWRGDKQHARVVAAGLTVALLILTLLAAAVWAAGRILARLDVLDTASWRLSTRGILWMALLLGCPIYVQRRNGMFYFGGQSGLVDDTYASLVTNSFHGLTYHRAQASIVLVGIAVSVVVFIVFAFLRFRRRTDSTLVAATAVFVLLAIVSVLVVLQHALMDTPYLMGRMALFLVPLYGLFVALLCAALADTRGGRVIVPVSLTVLVLFAVYHFAATANLTHVFDWPKDADTRQMIADVEATITSRPASAAPTRVGVEWFYYPVAVFYAKRAAPALIEVDVLPSEGVVDYLYVTTGSEYTQASDRHVVTAYPLSRSVLLQAERRSGMIRRD
jgi:hypothetical protein